MRRIFASRVRNNIIAYYKSALNACSCRYPFYTNPSPSITTTSFFSTFTNYSLVHLQLLWIEPPKLIQTNHGVKAAIQYSHRIAFLTQESQKKNSWKASLCGESVNEGWNKRSHYGESVNEEWNKLSHYGESINKRSGKLSHYGENPNAVFGSLSLLGERNYSLKIIKI